MISGINTDDATLMQFLINASRGLSGTGTSDSKSVSDAQGSEGDFLSSLNASFSKLDTNGDKSVSKDEFQSFIKENNKPMGPPPGMFIEGMDSSNITKIEDAAQTQAIENDSKKAEPSGFKSALDNFISNLDTNQDGQVSTEELTAAIDKTVDKVSAGKTNALTETWQKFSDSDLSKKLLEQFSKKLSEVYNSAASGNVLSSVANVVT